VQSLKKGSARPLTLSEKLLYSHLIPSTEQPWVLNDIKRGSTVLQLRPDRVVCHDATATMALLQFISAGLPKVAIPTTVHCDHLIVAERGAEEDIERALGDHREVYAFLSSAAKKYGIGFWKAGSGIIHVVIFENYAMYENSFLPIQIPETDNFFRPGGLIIGTDSHTPNAGGMGMLGIGVGGSDAVDAMAGMPWELACPKVIGVRLTGTLVKSKWTSSKDIICKLAGILTVSGGKGRIIEFFGPGVQSLGATAMATVCNMSAEIGSTSCIFPYTEAMGRYLSATNRSDVARTAEGYKDMLLTADKGSEIYYDEMIEIDLDTLEPHINGPFTPDLSHPLSQLKTALQKSDWPVEISSAMVGSCTNSSYEDLKKVQHLVAQAKAAGISKVRTPFLVSPGSEKIRATAEADGVLQDLREAGATVLSSSCGPCVGQWDRHDVQKGEKNSVISSFNRNFAGRHDSNPATHSFVTSPELATVFAYSGRLDFNPVTDSLCIPTDSVSATTGTFTQPMFHFNPPSSIELPVAYSPGEDRYQPPIENNSQLSVVVDPDSERLQLLAPFAPWTRGSVSDMALLIKVKGKCTTDHISPAGPWYNYRGHLENISNNMLIAANNAFIPGADSRSRGHTINPVTGKFDIVPAVAKDLKAKGVKWCIIGDHNYGEGSSREHAALEPRFLGGVAVIARSFARIHETNLKKQGMLPLTFNDMADYDRVREGDRIEILGVEADEMEPGRQVTMRVTMRNGETWDAKLNHTFHAKQIEWLRAGSALNYIKKTTLKDFA
jgi:aconitate hydratase